MHHPTCGDVSVIGDGAAENTPVAVNCIVPLALAGDTVIA
jgi:hypothetical protein